MMVISTGSTYYAFDIYLSALSVIEYTKLYEKIWVNCLSYGLTQWFCGATGSMLGDRLASVACSGSGLDNRYYVYAIRVFSDLRMVHWMEGLRLSRMSLVVCLFPWIKLLFMMLLSVELNCWWGFWYVVVHCLQNPASMSKTEALAYLFYIKGESFVLNVFTLPITRGSFRELLLQECWRGGV